jgi:dienelactone hydrolase
MSAYSRFFAVIFAAAGIFASVSVAIADDITIPASGGLPAIPGYMARPNGAGPFSAILILHSCVGLISYEKITADELAGQGYVALAIDTLKPQGVQNGCDTPAPMGTQLAAAGLNWLRTQSYVIANRLGLLGYSMGAIQTLNLIDPLGAVQPASGVRVAVAYYPYCGGRTAANLAVPLLILNGSADSILPPGPCQTFAQAAVNAGKTVGITTYPGATHAFNMPTDHPVIDKGRVIITYDPAAAADADAKMKAFFARYLQK